MSSRQSHRAHSPVRPTRRTVLRLGALAPLAPLAAGCRTAPATGTPYPGSDEPPRALVLGAGLAGLAATHALEREGIAVTLLEARPRVGGRVMTLRDPFLGGEYAEAGAIYVPAAHELTVSTVEAFGLELVPAMPPEFERRYLLDDRLLVARGLEDPDWPFALTAEEREAGLFQLLMRYVIQPLSELGDLTDADLSDERVLRLDRVSFSEYLRLNGASPAVVELLTLGYVSLFGDGPETVSALAVLRDLAHQRGPRATFRIAGGSSLLPETMAAGLRGPLRTGVQVVGFEQSETGVRVHVRLPGEEETTSLTAHYAICTLPTFPLRRIADPGWSRAKLRALTEVDLTSVTRVFLQYERRFWQPDVPVLSITTDGPLGSLNDATLVQPGETGILESYTTGPEAREVSTMGEENRLFWVREQLARMWEGTAQEYVGGATKAWHADPFAGGGYAWFRPGQISTHLAALRLPEGRVHFAGEHTSAWSAWMQGALESGERAASEVIARIRA